MKSAFFGVSTIVAGMVSSLGVASPAQAQIACTRAEASYNLVMVDVKKAEAAGYKLREAAEKQVMTDDFKKLKFASEIVKNGLHLFWEKKIDVAYTGPAPEVKMSFYTTYADGSIKEEEHLRVQKYSAGWYWTPLKPKGVDRDLRVTLSSASSGQYKVLYPLIGMKSGLPEARTFYNDWGSKNCEMYIYALIEPLG